MILTVAPVKALIFLVFIVILQQLEGNLIYPKVVGSSLGLPAIWVLAAVTVGGGVLGSPGMLLGVPLSAALYRLIRNDVYQISDEIPDEKWKNLKYPRIAASERPEIFRRLTLIGRGRLVFVS